MNVRIDKRPRIILMQFSSTNPKALPKLRFNPEEPKKLGQDVRSGQLILGPIENISVNEAIDDITTLGYVLVDAYYRQLPDPKGQGKKYTAAYFVFSLSEFAKPSEEFVKSRGWVFAELRKLAKESMWAVKGFDNPYFADNKEVQGEHAVVVNCFARKPLLENDGNPIMVWPEGCSKERPGNGKIALQPKDHLHIEIGSEATSIAA